jgi:hypothetical protein
MLPSRKRIRGAHDRRKYFTGRFPASPSASHHQRPPQAIVDDPKAGGPRRSARCRRRCRCLCRWSPFNGRRGLSTLVESSLDLALHPVASFALDDACAASLALFAADSATNLILEGKGFRSPLLTNAGFKYVLEIGRQDIPWRRSSLFAWVKPKRSVPPQAIFEIGDRIGADGSEIEPLDGAAVIEAARAIAAADIRTAGIVFLHSYTNPAHERHAGEILRLLLPDALVSLSSEVLPVFREYERSMTDGAERTDHAGRFVLCRAARTPRHRRHCCAAFGDEIVRRRDRRCTRAAPAETAFSGPAAGAAFIGAAAGYRTCRSCRPAAIPAPRSSATSRYRAPRAGSRRRSKTAPGSAPATTSAPPAMLTQLDATTLLLLGQTAEAHSLGSLVVYDRSPLAGIA